MKTSQEPSKLVVTQQNILAKSLGSNAIPWCLTLSPKLAAKADSALTHFYENNSTQNNQQQSFPKSWKKWKDSVLTKQYLKSFHKNFNSGDYTQMRSFWGIQQCNSSSDIPPSLASNIRFEKKDCISYVQKKTSNQIGNEEEERILAFTLKGTLFAEPAFTSTHSSAINDESKTLASELFQNIISLEENVYRWSVRGPRLFKSLLFPSSPDVIALQEYDIHTAEACYDNYDCSNPNNSTTTFEKAMRNKGYSGVFFSDPLLSRNPPSGIAIYFKHDKFELCHASGTSLSIHDVLLSQKYRDGNQDLTFDVNTSSTMGNHSLHENQINDTKIQNDHPWTITLPCGNVVDKIQPNSSYLDLTSIGPAALNMDMMEYWTPALKKSKQKIRNSATIGTTATSQKNDIEQHEQPSLMKSADRRNVGFIRLKERYFPYRVFHVMTTHLMTTSRDCLKTNLYPGEVRAREIFCLKNIAHQHVVETFHNLESNANDKIPLSMKPSEKKLSTLILLGDFNTTPDEIDVFSGNILSCNKDMSDKEKISIPTGFCNFDQSFLWKDLHHQPLKLMDAFVTVHSPKFCDDNGNNDRSSFISNAQKVKTSHCTSYNADRTSWIDYIFYTNDTLKISSKSDTSIPISTIPNETHGSDHLALTVKFQWKL